LGIFSSLSREAWREFSCPLQPAQYSRKQPIFFEGEVGHLVFLVNAGLVKVYRKSNGHSQILSLLGPGDVLSVEALSHDRYSCSAAAITDCTLCWAQSGNFTAFLSDHPAVAIRLVEKLQEANLRTRTIHGELATKRSLGRIAWCLLFFYERSEAAGNSKTFHLPLHRYELGELVGISAETASRQIHALEREGVIEVHNRRVTVLDHGRLRELAGLEG
jgi:CRP/FNR family transcriptional regulator